MSFDRSLPRSKRPRHRARSKAFSFVFQDGNLIETTTGLMLPRPSGTFVIGNRPLPDDRSRALFFLEDGRPACPETEAILQKLMSRYLFAIDGRLRPGIPPPEQVSDQAGYNRLLNAMGYGKDAGLAPWEVYLKKQRDSTGAGADGHVLQSIDDEWLDDDRRDTALHRSRWSGGSPDSVYSRSRERRSLLQIPRSDWRRILKARLAVIFDREPNDGLVRKLAEYMSREEKWHEWWEDLELRPLYKQAFNDKGIGALVRELENTAFRRANVARDRRGAKKPCLFGFSLASDTYTFALPRRSARAEGKETIRMRALVLAALQSAYIRRPIDPRILAAVVWKARRYLEEPQELRQGRLTLHRVASHFELTPRQVAYAAKKLRAEADRLIQSSLVRAEQPPPRA